MCRNIRTLLNFKPPATVDEIDAAALQFVRRISGFTKPSRQNAEAFNAAVAAVGLAAEDLLRALEPRSPPRDREAETAKARARAAKRDGTVSPSA